MRKIPWVWTVPNALSLFRLLLVPVIAITYWASRYDEVYLYVAAGALILSGLSDALDGWIARKFNQITEIGKLLDPIADKLTQVTVILCLTARYPRLLPLLAICVVKEACQAIGGFLLLGRGEKVRGAKWYGKLSTVIFYLAMSAVVVFHDMSDAWMYTLVGVVGAAMLFAFFCYFREYFRIRRRYRRSLSNLGSVR
ncbi:MAG: CDP-alcohol phosphatidyltransferase family protein [Clostridia bacterium]|nr:CDP-alcohol phosphatidyltransferase family protein [Clostridia bacterium]